MEWVEVTGKSVEEAVDAALDELGVDERDAEVEVVEEPKVGLFGLLRSEARVRARVAPTAARPKADRRRRERRRGGGSGGGTPTAVPDSAGSGAGRPVVPADTPPSPPTGTSTTSTTTPSAAGSASAAAPDQADPSSPDSPSGPRAEEVAEEFLRGLLEVFDLRAEVVSRELDSDTIEVAAVGGDLGLLIGPRGQTLAAIQDLTRGVLQRSSPSDRRRVLVDVGGYRQARREALERFTRAAAAEVLSTGVSKVLEPMPAPDRKVVHDTVNAIEGVGTVSEGEDPQRRVVIVRKDD